MIEKIKSWVLYILISLFVIAYAIIIGSLIGWLLIR